MAQGYTLKVDGVSYALPTVSKRMQVQRCSGGTTATRQLIFKETARHDNPSFDMWDPVELLGTGDWAGTFFSGKIWEIEHVGDPQNEAILYHCYGPLADLNRVPWIHPSTDMARMAINLTDEDDEDYDPDYQDMILGDIIDQYLTDMATEILAQANISEYDISSSLKEFVPKDLHFNAPTGGLDIIDQLLRYSPGFVRYVIPNGATSGTAHKLYIAQASDFSTKTITMGGGGYVQTNRVRPSLVGRYGAVKIVGKRELTDELLYYDPDDPNSDLEADWDDTLEATWDPSKQHDDEDYYKVFRVWKQKDADTTEWAKSTVRATPNTTIKVWALSQFWVGGYSDVQEIWYKRSLAEYNKDERTIVLASPAYKKDLDTGAYEPTELKLRLCRLGTPVTVRYPSSGYSGDAYTENGVEEEWVKYAEKLVKLTFTGHCSEDGDPASGIIRDFFAGVRWFDLSNKELTYSGSGYNIDAHSSVHFETDGSFESSEDDAYSIAVLDTSGDFDDIAESLWPSLTASPKPITITKHDTDDSIDYVVHPMLLSLDASDAHVTNWESLDLVVTSWTVDFVANTFTLTADDQASIAAESYSDLVQQRDLETTVEELEIYHIRNKDKETDSGSDGDTNFTNVEGGQHKHSQDDPVELDVDVTEMRDGSDVALLHMAYDSDADAIVALWKDAAAP